jgi:hypothetical protein
MELVAPREISVVVQGPVTAGITDRVLQSVRAHLPGAEIILSTWKGADVQGLDFDLLVANDDPGPVQMTSGPSNLNRMIWSSHEGLRRVTRPYSLKMTDMLLTGDRILSYFRRFRKTQEEYRLFRDRIVISNALTWRTSRWPNGIFHPGDLFGFGNTDDLRRLWNVPLHPFPGRAKFESEGAPIVAAPDELPISEMTSEQYVWFNALRPTHPVTIKRAPTAGDYRHDMLLLLNNFVIISLDRAGFVWLTRGTRRFSNDARFWGFGEYGYWYRREVEGRKFQLPPISAAGKVLWMKAIALSPAWAGNAWRKLRASLTRDPRV